MILNVLLAILALAALIFIWTLLSVAIRDRVKPRGEAVVLGAITNFFDTLGIGSFAPTMSWMKFRKLVPDHDIPPTMLAGHSLPTFVQSAVFLVILGVQVDPVLLLGCIIAMVAGGYVGVPIARRAPTRLVQLIVAFALLAAAVFYILANLDLMPIGGNAASLPVSYTLVAVFVHFLLGILLNFGVGAYAPTLAVLSLLGMDPRLAFPIMTSAGAFSMGASGIRLVRARDVDVPIVMGMVLGGIPAVLVAAFLVREMPVTMLRWLVVVVVLYAATLLLRAALAHKTDPSV